MPFKSGQSFTHVNKKLDKVINDIDGKMQEKALYVAATVGLGYATLMTPVDTSNLVNSKYISAPAKTIGGMYITCGYTSGYAMYVHNAKGTLKGKPRANGNGTYWSPDANPSFLLKGFSDHMSEVNDAFFKAMKL